MAGKFELKAASGGSKFMFNLKAGNGEVILTSEMYNSEDAALNGIESVRKNAADDARFERKQSKNGEPYFVLTATNGQTVGKSEMYKSPSSMENGIQSVVKNAPGAPLNDLTAQTAKA